MGEIIGCDSTRRPFTFSNMNIAETSRPIRIKFHLEHHLGEGKAA